LQDNEEGKRQNTVLSRMCVGHRQNLLQNLKTFNMQKNLLKFKDAIFGTLTMAQQSAIL
jgi:hypothetical protein